MKSFKPAAFFIPFQAFHFKAGSMTSMRWMIVSILALFGLAGCAEIEDALNGLFSEPSKDVIFWDDFSNPSSGWKTWSKNNSVVEYHNQGLRIQVNDTQYDYWSLAGQRVGDARIEVDATKLSGPDDNDFGIICRYQGENNFYTFLVSSDGYFGTSKMKDGRLALIGADKLQYSQEIHKGQSSNHIRVDCIGSTLTFYINGKKISEVKDGDFAAGDVGLLVGAYNLPGVEIFFDNFMVRKP